MVDHGLRHDQRAGGYANADTDHRSESWNRALHAWSVVRGENKSPETECVELVGHHEVDDQSDHREAQHPLEAGVELDCPIGPLERLRDELIPAPLEVGLQLRTTYDRSRRRLCVCGFVVAGVNWLTIVGTTLLRVTENIVRPRDHLERLLCLMEARRFRGSDDVGVGGARQLAVGDLDFGGCGTTRHTEN